MGSLLFYFGLWIGVLILESEREGSASMGSSVLVLLSSMTSTLNLFKRSDQGTLFASCSIQNPSLLEAPPSQKQNPSKPANPLSILLTALLLTVSHPSGRGSL